MKAVVYQKPGSFVIEDRPMPTILQPGDAIVKLVWTTICGTDLHILQGHVPSCTPGRILGHEGVGIVVTVGAGVSGPRVGDRVLISCISACGMCAPCRKGMTSHCSTGGWILGNEIDGTQAEYVRVPHASFSLHILPASIPSDLAVTFSDILPTAYECGVLNAAMQPGSSLAIVGPGPIGLAALMLVQRLFGPSQVVVIGRGESRLRIAKSLGAAHTFSSREGLEEAVRAAIGVNGGAGYDAVIEAVGTKESFDLAQMLVGPGGTIASLGVFGSKCDLHLDRLWNRNICLRTRLVDAVSTPDLIKMAESQMVHPEVLISHRFSFEDMMQAYETFQAASQRDALKVVISVGAETSGVEDKKLGVSSWEHDILSKGP
ncbi:alcohol dehydrogenase [Aspergillus steynii IBT 23096]|uniref:Alcohol dehydrogenase n=1 Tax=Aspergillus steynii IBT 23096 TaxID=1392250 RepID=A0A2I2FXE8_9EURO|nr:alcohol dehydrogenase [Aspergillus steynii IBT 23096]PLB45319.1 alcohol dehydrogenase [Aspergillus steynii IBT 23096]